MSAALPSRWHGAPADEDHPRLGSAPLTPAERRGRWEVRAAQWRAREIAEAVFGRVAGVALTGLRAEGSLRGLLCLEVPFADLERHRDREARFLAAAEADPILAQVRLVYVFGPEAA